MFQDRIRRHYDNLSRSYRRVADFVLSDYQAAAFMTAAGLAKAVDVDTTTVVRFAQRLGYPGYPELIEDIQQQVRAELDRSYLVEPADGSLPARIQRLVSEDRNHLEKALACNGPDVLEAIAGLLREGTRILVLGESYAAPLAESFAGMLREAGLPAFYVNGDLYERAVVLAHLTGGELVVGISPLTGPSSVAKALTFAREEGARTLACTPDLASRVARAADSVLYAPGETRGAVLSLAGLYSFCAAIVNAVGEEQSGAIGSRSAIVSRAMEELS
jgi:DNA-binding MurR/RpiR family transcriptional regulator